MNRSMKHNPYMLPFLAKPITHSHLLEAGEPIYTHCYSLEEKNPFSHAQRQMLVNNNAKRGFWETDCPSKRMHHSDVTGCPCDENLVRKALSCKSNQGKAATVIQRFFTKNFIHFRTLNTQKNVTMERLAQIEQAKQKKLDAIALQVEEVKLGLLRDTQRDLEVKSPQRTWQENLCQNDILGDATAVIEDLHFELKALKKENAFLQKRCTELRKRNGELQADATSIAGLYIKVSIKQTEWRILLPQFQKQLYEYQSRYQLAEQQWQANKLANKRIRNYMNRIIQMVEQREPGENNDDKWDLVDHLYQIQRGIVWKRKCNAKIKFSSSSQSTSSTSRCQSPKRPRGERGMHIQREYSNVVSA